MNHNKLFTPFEIQKEVGIPTAELKTLFEKNDIQLLSHSEISKIKRNKDFESIYDLHINKKLSLNEIYRDYGYSPPYSKRVLNDNGVDHLQFVNQLK
ncbi:AraC family transcriptional regulator [Lederbergia lenta]|uniref:AraC family transcriptional regulator n=1 Tax=Lederbergia lenta TaxID=1467 RepID=UPI00203D1721|nr:AraC family transcriptional regulator [Lederbergia lenta]MCM3110062.1 AraC family transcriptional regulator [Lederbergia lenta]